MFYVGLYCVVLLVFVLGVLRSIAGGSGSLCSIHLFRVFLCTVVFVVYVAIAGYSGLFGVRMSFYSDVRCSLLCKSSQCVVLYVVLNVYSIVCVFVCFIICTVFMSFSLWVFVI